MSVNYSGYVRKHGYLPAKGMAVEFEILAEKLFDVNARVRFLAFYDPDDAFQKAIEERDRVREALKAVSRRWPK